MPLAAAELAAGGAHAVVPQVHNIWDRRRCALCSGSALLAPPGRGENLDLDFTPEIHPCAGYYASEDGKRSGRVGAGGAEGGADGDADAEEHEAGAQAGGGGGGAGALCARNWCTGSSGRSAEDVLKVLRAALKA